MPLSGKREAEEMNERYLGRNRLQGSTHPLVSIATILGASVKLRTKDLIPDLCF
jgi:hypothetical protein